MKKIDSAYLEDILEAIDKVDEFLGKLTLSEFEEDERTQFAVFHALEVIGEASNKLSKNFLSQNLDFPAREAIELRNLLIHGYDQIRLDIVWKTIKDHLPALKKQVKEMLG
ncbi:MAG: DUF86 domain-containing protein [Patescibacteria group bacterium]|nr:DUF86 domain-containing protein [Patescibacteria group bacterium]